MKKIFVLFLLIIVLTACSAPPLPQEVQTSTAVQIDPTIQIGLAGLLIGLFTAGFVYVFEVTKLDLRQYAVPLSITVSTFIVAEAQQWIDALGTASDPLIIVVLRVLGALLAGFGVLRLTSHQPATLLAK